MKKIIITLLLLPLISISCKKKDALPIVSIANFTVTIDENPSLNQNIGQVNSSIENANNWGYEFINMDQPGDLGNYINIDNDGNVIITDSSAFDYETQTSFTTQAKLVAHNSSDQQAEAIFSVTVHLNDLTETPPLTVQQRLDGGGEAPIDIYNSNIPLDSIYGKTYQGGIIYYLDITWGNGLIAAPTDQSSGIIWDPNQPSGSGTAGTSSTIGSGNANTSNIVAQIGSGNYAAEICLNLTLGGYSDWLLPSKDELAAMYTNLHMNGFGGFTPANYWTSTETSTATIVWYHKFDTGQIGQAGSEQLFYVRASREFY